MSNLTARYDRYGRPFLGETWEEKAVRLSRTKRFKGKPLSLAVHLNKPWRTVVEFLDKHHLANKEEFLMHGSVGLSEYGD